MPAVPQISELWTIKIYYKGTSGRYKRRPVLIIDCDDDGRYYTIQEITTEAPKPKNKSYFQKTKKQIVNWAKYGLDEESYVKCAPTNTHKVERVRLIAKIGTMDEEEFEKIVNEIVKAKVSFRKIKPPKS